MLTRAIDADEREGLTWDERWSGPDKGLISSWEAGRRYAEAHPDQAAEAKRGALVVLPWKGGLTKSVKSKRYAPLLYFAMWQGLRGDALHIDIEAETAVTCTKHKTTVIFTRDHTKYAMP